MLVVSRFEALAVPRLEQRFVSEGSVLNRGTAVTRMKSRTRSTTCLKDEKPEPWHGLLSKVTER